MVAIKFMELEGVIEYIEPKTVVEACSLLAEYQGKAKVIAGGTALVDSLKNGQTIPEVLVNLKTVPNLDEVISGEEQELKIGALVTLYELDKSAVVRGQFPILAQAVHEMLSEATQRWVYYMATIGGTLCNATSLDMVPPLFVLGSKAKIQGPKGWRAIPLEEFFTEAGQTILQNDEILIEVGVQKPPLDSGLWYIRRRMGETPISVATLLKLDSGHTTVEDIRIVLAAPNLFRAGDAEAILKGENPAERLLKKAARVATNNVTIEQDAVRDMVYEALLQAADSAVGDFALGY
jgi:CO/xanthine dehydrogenase FAD-binding subunit